LSRQLDPAVELFLLDRLGPTHPNRRFAEAVTTHLGVGPTAVWSQAEAAKRVVELLETRYNTEDAEILARSPELVASLFQNADMLVASDEGSRALAILVMKAIEHLVDR
jgi:hypothetical protein